MSVRNISVRVVTRSSKRGVEEPGDGSLRVHLHSPPVGGKANEELLAAVGKHLGVPKSNISIVGGARSRDKLLRVEY